MKKVFLVILCLIFCLGCSKIIVPKVTIQQYTDLYSLEDNLYKIWTCVGIENILTLEDAAKIETFIRKEFPNACKVEVEVKKVKDNFISEETSFPSAFFPTESE